LEKIRPEISGHDQPHPGHDIGMASAARRI
jgi:hypothetical protein